jgi:hypothetical protein
LSTDPRHARSATTDQCCVDYLRMKPASTHQRAAVLDGTDRPAPQEL